MRDSRGRLCRDLLFRLDCRLFESSPICWMMVSWVLSSGNSGIDCKLSFWSTDRIYILTSYSDLSYQDSKGLAIRLTCCSKGSGKSIWLLPLKELSAAPASKFPCLSIDVPSCSRWSRKLNLLLPLADFLRESSVNLAWARELSRAWAGFWGEIDDGSRYWGGLNCRFRSTGLVLSWTVLG